MLSTAPPVGNPGTPPSLKATAPPIAYAGPPNINLSGLISLPCFLLPVLAKRILSIIS